ncbi:tyrosine-protein kinase SYK-like [Mizuhopecten yessoensis]|uniref:non-specific protein-tyrosine kinase n=1 Tax=Mizuhopecten yessoensis TaxID=6573 RepID=A0A210PJ78_MIZYE|nr:tyrosine-protein kinase SYK-like [Mizuhopecten yessoensis]OWF36548.1 Tyrosine-protein kinase SYK [Mizuhopecten yessoensis]
MANKGPWQPAILPSTVMYFYGRVTREEAECILQGHGALEGLYLLRESIGVLGNFAISICHNNNVHHYAIEKQHDGQYRIGQGRPCNGPVELIQHHQVEIDGFITIPTHPCNRLPGQSPIAFRGMTYVDLENALLTKAEKEKIKPESIFGAQRQHLILKVAMDLHQKQPWFHNRISRDEALQRLERDQDHQNGKFLVRLRDDKRSFALTLMYTNEPRHYIIQKQPGDNKLGIPEGPKFDCLLMMIDHYHNKSDGLLCKLTSPCVVPGYDTKRLSKYLESCSNNVNYTSVSSIVRNNSTSRSSNLETGGASRSGSTKRALPPAPKGKASTAKQNGASNRPSLPSSRRPGLPPLPAQDVLARGEWDPPEHTSRNGMDMDEVDSKIYDTVPRNKETFNLRRDQITLEGDLGSGQFGSVKKGMCSIRGGQTIPVAVKTLKNEDVSGQAEMMKEAEFMSQLTNPYIVRMIGVCKAESIMLVLELLPCGPLNSYLKQNKDTPQWNVCELMWQVAEGMNFLSGKKFVHRDLAARNVLLSNRHTAKISDFGMSKALGREGNYYEASEAGRWPLKWYAPECVYYWKFDTKSDVWSYGVTLWEATSYGEKPYRKMKGQEILEFVENNNRLTKPEHCPEDIYVIMLECWKYDKKERPSFSELAVKMEYQYRSLKENGG